MEKATYDVIIIGAGPGGLECARVLQDSKLKILLLEQNPIIGPKPCGGGVTESEKAVDIPDELCKVFHKEILMIGRRRYEAKLRYKRKIFDRYELGQYQLSKIKGDNVTIVSDIRVIKITALSVVTSVGEFNYRYLVGADGTNSLVRKYLSLSSRFCQGIYYEISGQFNEFISYYDPKTIKSGYIWEFPHKSHNNVGLYYDLDFIKPADARAILDSYMKKRGYSTVTSKFFGALVNFDYRGVEFGNVYLVGDAAGLASRMHGGGINNAITSGRDVAKRILDPKYIMVGLKEVLTNKRREDHLLNFYNKHGRLQWIALRLLILLVQLRLI